MDLIKSQSSSRKIIENAYVNFKKAPKDRLSKPQYIQCRIDQLENEWNQFLTTHRKLSLVATDEMFESDYFTEDVYDTVEEVYINYNSDLREILESLTPSPTNCNPNGVSSTSSNCNNVKLPEITIPTFSGNYSEWTTFRDLFVSLVHQNTSIDNVQKMHYLKGLLTGEAEQLLRHVPISSANYLESWSMLNKRYNNKSYLSNCLLKRFLDQPNIAKESCTAIKQLLDTTTETLNGLKNVGVYVDSWDAIVIYIVSSKLDIESRKQWETNINASEDLPSLNQLIEFLEVRFRSLEFLDEKQNQEPHFPNKPKVLHALSKNQQKKSCQFCKEQGHKMSHCKYFARLHTDTRRRVVQTIGLCLNCLGHNHFIISCRIPTRCQICKNKHHSLLHPKPCSEPPRSSPEPKPEVGNGDAASHGKVPPQSEEHHTPKVIAHFSTKSLLNQILLPTALVEVPARNGRVQVLRALTDQGSQASVITESAVQLLGLKRIPNSSEISGLGGEASPLSSNSLVAMSIKSCHDPNFEVQVSAHALVAITSLLPPTKVTNWNWPELETVTLADPEFHTPNKIDILLGADVYGQIVRDGLIKGPTGIPIAQNTALGWVLSGPTHSASDNHSNSANCYHANVNMPTGSNNKELLTKYWTNESDSVEPKSLTEMSGLR